MNTDFYAFGEMLWDCLPSGRHAGGAPFNVAVNLAQLGGTVTLISAVGRDSLGDEILKVAGDKGVNTEFVTRARTGLATGTVKVTLDASANATYKIVQPVAWDEIGFPESALKAVSKARGLVFGSLACRSAHNRVQLNRLLAVQGPMKFFDVNLRPPFADPALVMELAKCADVIKLNDGELGQLISWLRTGTMTASSPQSADALEDDCKSLVEATGTTRICITRGADGAAFWDGSSLVCVTTPQVVVRDTVGAGDAFMAGLVMGLTHGTDLRAVLSNACKLGAFVASQEGATPALPNVN